MSWFKGLLADLLLLALIVAGFLVGIAYFKTMTILDFERRSKCTERGGLIVNGAQGDTFVCVKPHA